jgi:hypothetical protein
VWTAPFVQGLIFRKQLDQINLFQRPDVLIERLAQFGALPIGWTADDEDE